MHLFVCVCVCCCRCAVRKVVLALSSATMLNPNAHHIRQLRCQKRDTFKTRWLVVRICWFCKQVCRRSFLPTRTTNSLPKTACNIHRTQKQAGFEGGTRVCGIHQYINVQSMYARHSRLYDVCLFDLRYCV